jgi:hypothetical protein
VVACVLRQLHQPPLSPALATSLPPCGQPKFVMPCSVREWLSTDPLRTQQRASLPDQWLQGGCLVLHEALWDVCQKQQCRFFFYAIPLPGRRLPAQKAVTTGHPLSVQHQPPWGTCQAPLPSIFTMCTPVPYDTGRRQAAVSMVLLESTRCCIWPHSTFWSCQHNFCINQPPPKRAHMKWLLHAPCACQVIWQILVLSSLH